jgi:N6-L-threonylcarbamoyladenine synthase
MGSLLVGMQTAKALALAANLPVIGVDHIEAHLLAVTLEPPASEPDCRAVQPPFVALVASGGHTATYDVDDQGQCTVLGHTLDDAAGEAFDKVGKLLGLPYPGGVSIDRLARSGDPGRWPLPRAMLDSRSLDFSFSGLKTAVRLHVESRFPDGVPELELPHLAASVQEAIVEVLVEKAVRAARRANRQTIVLAGGVAANSRLRARARSRFAEEGIDIALTPRAYCTDNAAMIAGLALRRWSLGLCEPSADLSFDAYANRLTGTPRAARGLLGKQRYRT